MEQFLKEHKLSVEVKQTSKGVWYVNSLTINANDNSEFEGIFDYAMKKLEEKIRRLNLGQVGKSLEKPERKQEPIMLNPEEEKIFQKLKQIRIELAMREGFPPYFIFNDHMLKSLVRQRPKSEEEMKGLIGEKKFLKYGKIFLDALSGESQKL